MKDNINSPLSPCTIEFAMREKAGHSVPVRITAIKKTVMGKSTQNKFKIVFTLDSENLRRKCLETL